MAEKHLGPAFEIHGGGLDLVFPHHENELAQSRGAGREFARIWMHNGMLELTGEKMSKSLGNIVTLQEVLDEWGARPCSLLPDRALAQAARLLRRDAGAGAGAGRGVPQRLPRARRAGAEALGALRGRARRRLQHAGGARGPARVARPRAAALRALDVFGLGVARASGRRRLREAVALPSEREARARAATSPRPTGCATRSRRTAGRCATSAERLPARAAR